MKRQIAWGLLAMTLMPGLEGCTHLDSVNAWEKGNLAKPDMSLDDAPLEQRYLQHIYTSKENSSGDYEHFFIHTGTRYCHVHDPRTG